MSAVGTLEGSVLSANGNPIGGTRVTLISALGVTHTALTDPIGYYRFDDVQAGEIFLIGVRHKAYRFAEPVRLVIVSDKIDEIDFIAIP